MTYGDIYKEFCKKFPNVEVEDYRPAVEMHIPQLSRGIPNAIIVWIKDGSKVIYMAESEVIKVEDCVSNIGDYNIPIHNAVIIPEGATNGDVIEENFGKDVYYTLIRMMYSSCCEKLKDWWNAPYKAESEEV